MQKELGVPEIKIAHNYVTTNFKSVKEGDSTRTTLEAFDFVDDRKFSIVSYDDPPVSETRAANNAACFAFVEDKINSYYLYVSSYPSTNKYEKSLYDSLFISFTEKKSGANSAAIYNSQGQLSAFRTDYRAGLRTVGNLSMEEIYPPVFAVDFMDNKRFFIHTYEQLYESGQKKVIPKTLDTGKIDIEKVSSESKSYIASLPFDVWSSISVPIYMGIANGEVSLILERPDEMSKQVKFPTQLAEFSEWGLQHAEPQAFISLPFRQFKNEVFDNIEPITRA